MFQLSDVDEIDFVYFILNCELNMTDLWVMIQ